MKRNTILATLGIALVVVAYLGAQKIIANKKKAKPKVEKVVRTAIVKSVTNSNIPIKITANGSLMAKRRLEIYAEVQGIFEITNKLFKTGQSYNKGEKMIGIDSNEYYATVKSSKSNLYNLITSIMPDLKIDYPDAFKKWNDYLLKFDINKTVPELPSVNTEAERFFITGKGIYTSYYDVKNLEQRLGKYIIRAPFTGVLTEANVTEGTLIRSGQKLGEFINTSEYELEVSIPKEFAELITVNKPVELTNLDKTQNYTGKISRVNAAINPTTQTITAFVEVKHPQLKEGMFLEANIEAKQIENAIEIDRSLLLDNNKIFVVKNDKLEKISVKPVFFSDKKVVLKDVPESTQIVYKNIPGAYTGMLVEVAEEK